MSGESQVSQAPFQRRTFDALVAGLSPSSPVWEQLRAVGYDPAESRQGWTVEVFHAAMDVLRRHRFGSLPESEGYRQLGHAWAEGFAGTPVGEVIAASLRGATPEQALRRLVQHVRTARVDAEIHAECVGDRHWRLRLPVEAVPDFNRGLFEAFLASSAGPGLAVDVDPAFPVPPTLVVRW